MTRLASTLVRRYPPAWRERYEAEVLALLEESRPGVRDVFELAQGLVVERVKSWVEPGEHPTWTAWVLQPAIGVARFIPSLVFVVTAAVVGDTLQDRTSPPSDALQWTAFIGMMVVLAWFWGRLLTRRAFGKPDDVQSRHFAVWERALLIVLLLGGLTVAFWAPGWQPRRNPEFHALWRWVHLYIYVGIVHGLFARAWPLNDMWVALNAYQVIAPQYRRAKVDLEACRAMEGPEAGWHLAAAERQYADLKTKHDAAREALSAFGYRARLRQ